MKLRNYFIFFFFSPAGLVLLWYKRFLLLLGAAAAVAAAAAAAAELSAALSPALSILRFATKCCGRFEYAHTNARNARHKRTQIEFPKISGLLGPTAGPTPATRFLSSQASSV